MTETFEKDNKALDEVNNKPLKLLNERSIIGTYLMSPLCKIPNPEHTSQI